jgi:hypothetical protein
MKELIIPIVKNNSAWFLDLDIKDWSVFLLREARPESNPTTPSECY